MLKCYSLCSLNKFTVARLAGIKLVVKTSAAGKLNNKIQRTTRGD
jgi:hypothetical protein